MAERGLSFAGCTGEIDVETDESKIVDCGVEVARTEIAGVIAQHAAEGNLWELFGVVRHLEGISEEREPEAQARRPTYSDRSQHQRGLTHAADRNSKAR